MGAVDRSRFDLVDRRPNVLEQRSRRRSSDTIGRTSPVRPHRDAGRDDREGFRLRPFALKSKETLTPPSKLVGHQPTLEVVQRSEFLDGQSVNPASLPILLNAGRS